MSYTIDNAVTGNYPDYAIDAAKVVISRGALTPGADTELGVAGSNVLVKWGDNSGSGSALATDKALIAVVNQSKGEAITVAGGAARSAGREEVAAPESWVNCELDCYLGFVSADGREVSNSVYVGEIVIVG